MKAHSWIILCAILQLLIICGLESWIFVKVYNMVTSSYGSNLSVGVAPSIFSYQSLFLFGQLFHLILVFDAVRNKNTIQIICSALFNILSFVHACVQPDQLKKLTECLPDAHDNTPRFLRYRCPPTTISFEQASAVRLSVSNLSPFLYAIIGALGFFICISTYFSYKVYIEYGWLIFQVQGAGIAKRRMLRRYHLFIVLLKVKMYFALSTVVQGVSSYYVIQKFKFGDAAVNQLDDILVPIFSVLIGIGALYYVTGYFGLRNGSIELVIIFLTLVIVTCIMSVLSLVIVHASEQFRIAKSYLTLLTCVLFIVDMFTFMVAVDCVADFGKGFSNVVTSFNFQSSVIDQDTKSQPSITRTTSPVLSIDQSSFSTDTSSILQDSKLNRSYSTDMSYMNTLVAPQPLSLAKLRQKQDQNVSANMSVLNEGDGMKMKNSFRSNRSLKTNHSSIRRPAVLD